jgi:hypothetical protein
MNIAAHSRGLRRGKSARHFSAVASFHTPSATQQVPDTIRRLPWTTQRATVDALDANAINSNCGSIPAAPHIQKTNAGSIMETEQ